jgi:hypothetical protein
MLKNIDIKIQALLNYRDSSEVINDTKLRAMVCTVIEKLIF